MKILKVRKLFFSSAIWDQSSIILLEVMNKWNWPQKSLLCDSIIFWAGAQIGDRVLWNGEIFCPSLHLSIHFSICLFIRSSIHLLIPPHDHPARPEAPPARPEAQPARHEAESELMHGMAAITCIPWTLDLRPWTSGTFFKVDTKNHRPLTA